MKERFIRWFWQYLICFDQKWALRIRLWTYVIRGRGDEPNADETISSIVGRRALIGRPWALRWEKRINRLFKWASRGRELNHCRDSIEYDEFKE